MKKKTTTKTTQNTTQNTVANTSQNTNSTVTPTNPQFATDAVSGLTGRVNDYFAKLDPTSLVPGADPLQTQAAQRAGGLGTPAAFGQATDILGRVAGAGPQSVNGASIASLIPGLMNPELENVVKTSLAGYDVGAGQQMGQANLDLANDSTFGGSGGALFKRGLAGDIVRNRGALEAGLRSDAWNRAAGLAATQAGMDNSTSLANANFGEQALARQGAAAGGMADIGAAQGENDRANIGVQAQIGDILRQIAAARAGAPGAALAQNASILGSIPFNLFTGQTSSGSSTGTTNEDTTGSLTGKQVTTSSGLNLGNILQAAALAAAPFTGGASISAARPG